MPLSFGRNQVLIPLVPCGFMWLIHQMVPSETWLDLPHVLAGYFLGGLCASFMFLLGRSTVLSASHYDSVLNSWVQEVTAKFFHYKAPLFLLTNGLTYYHCLHKSKISSCKVIDSFICLVFFAHLLVGNHLRKSLTDNWSYFERQQEHSFLFLLIVPS